MSVLSEFSSGQIHSETLSTNGEDMEKSEPSQQWQAQSQKIKEEQLQNNKRSVIINTLFDRHWLEMASMGDWAGKNHW